MRATQVRSAIRHAVALPARQAPGRSIRSRSVDARRGSARRGEQLGRRDSARDRFFCGSARPGRPTNRDRCGGTGRDDNGCGARGGVADDGLGHRLDCPPTRAWRSRRGLCFARRASSATAPATSITAHATAITPDGARLRRRRGGHLGRELRGSRRPRRCGPADVCAWRGRDRERGRRREHGRFDAGLGPVERRTVQVVPSTSLCGCTSRRDSP